MIIEIRPIYGFGWTDGEHTIDTPEAFSADVLSDKECLLGTVVNGQFSEHEISMTSRHSPFDGCVNVAIYQKSGI